MEPPSDITALPFLYRAASDKERFYRSLIGIGERLVARQEFQVWWRAAYHGDDANKYDAAIMLNDMAARGEVVPQIAAILEEIQKERSQQQPSGEG